MCRLSRKTRCDGIRGYVMESTIQTFRKRGNAQLPKSRDIIALVGYGTLNVGGCYFSHSMNTKGEIFS